MKAAGLSAKESTQFQRVEKNDNLGIVERERRSIYMYRGAFLCSKLDMEERRKRMENEVIYARDSTRSIPSAAVLFQIMKIENDRKRRTLTPEEFAENSKIVRHLCHTRRF